MASNVCLRYVLADSFLLARSSRSEAAPAVIPSTRCRGEGFVGISRSAKCDRFKACSLRQHKRQVVFSPCFAAVSTQAEAETDSSYDANAGDSWVSFAEKVSGNWAGYVTDMAPSGEPKPLPADAVPPQFRDWGLSLYAWKVQSTSVASLQESELLQEQQKQLSNFSTRLAPAIGNEQVPYSVEETQLLPPGSGAAFLGFCSNGCYAAAFRGRSVLSQAEDGVKVLEREEVLDGVEIHGPFELEHCLVAEEELEGEGDVDLQELLEWNWSRARVRVIQKFNGGLASLREGRLPELSELVLFRERWQGPCIEEGEENLSAASPSSEVAEGPRVGLEAVEGTWLASSCRFHVRSENHEGFGNFAGEAVELLSEGEGEGEEVKRQLKEEGAVLLPQGVWSRVIGTSDGGVILKAGWLVAQDKALVSRFEFTKEGKLSAVVISTERRTSATV
eukprot:TRINITY_DN1175_c0_g1_i1.p1 TRINITY_DN1175_c0_g1~~TRINITY_DN1175_c0_g1_i1.p1  ORF type:complete len:467 (-),score=91.78 TRINITY_DN1175_c0_g1_i1:84-1427(-)